MVRRKIKTRDQMAEGLFNVQRKDNVLRKGVKINQRILRGHESGKLSWKKAKIKR